MSREELLATRAKVQRQTEILRRPQYAGFYRQADYRLRNDTLRDELTVILSEIDAELAELDSKNA